MILLIDNYDSFSYNLYQLIGSLDPDIRVIRNDELTVQEIDALHPDGIVISPGPGRPGDAGICEELVRTLEGRYPILGVCLGEQAIAEAYGATIGYAKKLMHGKQSITRLDGSDPLFQGLPEEIPVARYHSLAVEEDTLPPELRLIAETKDGEVMGIRHEKFPTYGVQFHPESIMTPDGSRILSNFLTIIQDFKDIQDTKEEEK